MGSVALQPSLKNKKMSLRNMLCLVLAQLSHSIPVAPTTVKDATVKADNEEDEKVKDDDESYAEVETELDISKPSMINTNLAKHRGSRVFRKKPRKYTGCVINMGLGHNCDYREAIGGAKESQHWDSVG